jgi:predicted ArsR family transcriptional regulator
MRRLLAVLIEDAERFRPAGELAEASGLGTAAFPLLADLVRRGHAEQAWRDADGRPTLVYRLTPGGRAHAAGFLGGAGA